MAATQVRGSQIKDGDLTDADVASANKDGTSSTPSLRTLGTGAAQACAGNDSRLSDSRAPSGSAGGDLGGTYPNPTLSIPSLDLCGRLTLTSGTAVTTSDVTGATTVYFTPHYGDRISLYTSSAWKLYTFSELSLALGTLTSGKNYDVFAYDVTGAVTLKLGPAWSSDTARGTGAGTTELELKNGIWTNKVSITSGPGANAGRYLGSFRTTSTTATEDSVLKRFLWNANPSCRASRPLILQDSTSSWTYTTASYRQARGQTANKFEFLLGLLEDAVEARLGVMAANSSNGHIAVGIGLDSTTASSAIANPTHAGGSASTDGLTAIYSGLPGLGYHYLAWLEISQATGTTTWYGQSANLTTNAVSGMIGSIRA